MTCSAGEGMAPLYQQHDTSSTPWPIVGRQQPERAWSGAQATGFLRQRHLGVDKVCCPGSAIYRRKEAPSFI